MFVLLGLLTVVLATKPLNRAYIVIEVPSKLVKNGSKVFFNEKSFSKLVISSDWKGDPNVFQQFGEYGRTCSLSLPIDNA